MFSEFRLFILLVVIFAHPIYAQDSPPHGDPIVIHVIDLKYADAEQLADTLEPLLSPQGRIVVYKPTNSLIIKDRKSIIERLAGSITKPSEP